MLCADIDAMAHALPRAMILDPEDCRSDMLGRFDRETIVLQHVELYQRIIEQSKSQISRQPAPTGTLAIPSDRNSLPLLDS